MPLLLNTSYSKDKFLSIKPSRKKKIWLGVIAGFLVVALGWWVWAEFTPRPLGDKLEYLGKENYGNIFGFDYFPSSVYYYGTDMASEELANYFPKAMYESQSSRDFAQFMTSDGPFIFLYKKDSSFTTDKKYIISLSDSQYQHAKNSL